MCKNRNHSNQGSGSYNYFSVIALTVCAAILLPGHAAGAITMLNTNYTVEAFAEYQQEAFGGLVRHMTTGDAGTVYIGHGAIPSSIVAATDDNVSILATGFNNIQGVEWTGGTSYGDNVYAAEVGTSSIVKVDTSGNASTFRPLPEQPLVVALDKTGNYGNQLYAATRNSSRIYSIGESGSLSEFLNISTLTDGFPLDLAFDTTGRYNGYMYLSLMEVNNENYQGVLSIDPQGNVTQFKAGGYWGANLAFDTTSGLDFGGDLYVCGGAKIFQLTPEGNLIQFLTTDRIIQDFAFGSDGALYVMEVDSSSTYIDTVTISKITVVPEPCTLLLLGLGGLLIKRK